MRLIRFCRQPSPRTDVRVDVPPSTAGALPPLAAAMSEADYLDAVREREEQERELRRMEQAAAIQQQNLTQRLGEMEEAKIVMQQQQLMIKTLSTAAGRAP